MLLHGKVGLVSGVGPGMGHAIAVAFAREGADVVLAARTQASLDTTASEVRALGRQVLAMPTDVTLREDCLRIVAAAEAQFGRVDVLVNNAFLGPPYDPVESAKMDDWRRIFDVNVFGSVQLSQAVIPGMKARRSGAIVMVNSMSMRIIEPRFGGYAASKGALMTAAQTMAHELGPDGIRVNSVVPGYIWGPNLQRWFEHLASQRGITPEAIYDEIAARIALRHIPTSAEIADAVVFLASDLARAITGQALDVNGGHFYH